MRARPYWVSRAGLAGVVRGRRSRNLDLDAGRGQVRLAAELAATARDLGCRGIAAWGRAKHDQLFG
jgi:hypothetical protein